MRQPLIARYGRKPQSNPRARARYIGTMTLVVAMLGTACASIPREAVELSNVVGTRIATLQVGHEALLAEYFRLSRDRIDDFLMQRWVPQFLENFVADADLLGKLTSVEPLGDDRVASLVQELQRRGVEGDAATVAVAAVQSAFGDGERGQIVLEFAEAATTEIETRRSSLFAPLERTERAAMKELRGIYAELIAAQNSVTAHLTSIHEVQVQQDAILSRLGLLQERDRALDQAISINERIVGIIDSGEEVTEILKQLGEAVEAAVGGNPGS